MEIVVALLIGALLGWLVGRRRKASALEGIHQQDLARAWQEGYDAGSVASQRQLTPGVASRDGRTAPRETSPTLGRESPPGCASASSEWPVAPLAPLSPPSVSGQQMSEMPAAAESLPTPPPRSGDELTAPPTWRPATPEELAAEKQRRDHRNVNITLYAACLLLVAAASLFIGTALPAPARMVGLGVVTALFYVGGLIVHATSRRVRPAATAFTGTGLALIPISGLALETLLLHRPVISWLVTSLVGTVLMVVAAARLRSRVVAYLAVPFLLSTVIASGAAVQQGMVWGLVASIAVATVMAWMTADDARTRWLPEEFRSAMADTHHWITPGVVLLSLIIGSWLEPVHFVVLLVAASAYYVTVAVLGRPGLRLYAAYAARGSTTAAVGAFVWMLQGSTLTLTGALACVVALQVLITTGDLWRRARTDSPVIRAGFLPPAGGVRADQIVCLGLLWCLAVTGQVLLPRSGTVPVSVAWAVLVSVAVLVAVLGVRSARPVAESLAWQAVVPFALLPGVLLPVAQSPWRLVWVVGVALAVQSALTLLLRRSIDRARTDVRLAADLTAVWAVVLAALLVERWDSSRPQLWPAVVVVVLAAAWAAVHAFRPGEPEDILDAGAWTVFVLIGLGSAGYAINRPGESSVVHVVMIAVMLIVGGLSVWWLRGRLPVPQDADERPPERASVEMTGPLGLVLSAAAVVLVSGWVLLTVDGAAWLAVIALVLLSGWLTVLALLSRARLGESLRLGAMLGGQAVLALAVATTVELLGADGAAARAAAAVTLAGGLGLRHLLGHRSGALAAGSWSTWLVAGGLAVLWTIELADTQDRAALTVIAVGLAVVGTVLGAPRGGPWAQLAAFVAVTAGWSDLMPLRHGGWLPEPLFPAAVVAALYLLLMLKLTLDEARSDVRTNPRFRAVALPVLWTMALLCATVPVLQLGVLAVAMAVAGLALYALSRTRALPPLVVGTVLAVPGTVLLVLSWGRAEAAWTPEQHWWTAVVGIVSAALLIAWAALDRRTTRAWDRWDQAAFLDYGGLAALLLAGLFSLASAPDTVVLVGCAMTALVAWLPVAWWARPTDPFPAGWRRHALDAAVLATVVLGLRAWWQLAEVGRVLPAIWWSMLVAALTLAGIALGHLRDPAHSEVRRRRATVWGAAGAAVMTAACVVVLLDGSALLQLLSLLGFAILLVVGLTTRTSLFTWWGAAGITVSVLWYLRGYTVLWLTLLGVVLIVVAVSQLMRGGRQEERAGSGDGRGGTGHGRSVGDH